ncbi:hypothetical protein BCR37DRAFT_342278 [Protomyces lactucae-debilis]|uniref:1-phosphatidylinositol-3-phosphate 5-kinase n=1 Tax=Protomyces lactucae-debilis TaxID=2754530 RepID=A0A1Y2FV33_PROLT|nr:uncharacterized protein BCR37DRAFT_342278 [Protomyces lactucae-debilis]ORY87858.1 hypothetical protein BCR37DRAFT_342278 [Protomyces lactucae-debilis]
MIRHLSVHGRSGPSTPGQLDASRGRTRSTSNTTSVQTQVTELNLIGRAHVKGLLHQLLKDAHVEDIESWERTLSPILTLVAENIRPKVKEGASAYINNYVKIKRIPGAKMSQTQFISGAVFTNKLAHKRMARHIDNPRIMLISFPLEYHRADSQLMSLEPIIAQEKEYLQNLVSRMMDLRPSLVLIDRSVSGLALEYLLENNVAVAYGVKPTVMAIVAELTGADIITSVDRLAFHPRVGKCDSFSVKTFINYEPPKPFKKTYMFIQGCPPDLGCTVVLRGAPMSTLESIKRIMELMIFVVYNQKLEASLVKDQHAIQRAPESFLALQNTDDLNLLDASSGEALRGKPFSKMIELFEHRILSSSPGVQFEPPYILRKAYDLETRLERHKMLLEKSDSQELTDHESKLLYGNNLDDISDLSTEQQRNVRQIVQAAEASRLQQELEHVKNQWESLLDQNPELTSPWTRQSISVLYSTVCTESGTPCSLPQTEVIEYYKDTYNEYPLGQYVEECIIAAMHPCPTVLCQRRNMDHHRSYVHAEARVTVVTEPFPCHLPGMQDTILMWSYCKQCKITSPLVPMSDNSWAYSFGKYLELTFYDKDLCVRIEDCPHNLCRDHVRYFGFRDMAVRFDYDPIEIMALSVPQPRIDWKPEGFIRLKNEEFKSLQFKISVFYDSLEFRLYNMNAETLVIEQTEAYKADIAIMRQQAKDERVYLANLLQEIHDNSPPLDYLCLNRALRATQEKVTQWNQTFEELERLYLPSEKDIRRLTTAHLKKLFLPDESVRPALTEEDVDVEAKRSVSMPVGMTPDKDETSEKTGVAEKAKPAPEKVIHPVASMPVIGEHDEEPKGFHPRRVYEDLVKPRVEAASDAESLDLARANIIPDLNATKAEYSELPKPAGLLRTKSEDVVPMHRPAGSQASSRTSSVDLKHGPSGIPVPRSTMNEVWHLRKKSTSGSHVLSKQIQDLGEAIVGSVEKRWQEQKRFSSVYKDTPQKNKAGETKVSSLAKHFDQLSREFEKERLKARKLLSSRGRPTFAVATSKPKVAVFNNVDDAVDESDDEDPNLEPLLDYNAEPILISNPATGENTPKSTPLLQPNIVGVVSTEQIPEQHLGPDPGCKELDEGISETESVSPGDARKVVVQRQESDMSTGLVPAAERSTLLKTLSNFWADRSSSAWTALEYPLPPSEHMFLESDVVIREDEPSSLIAFTLSAEEYIAEIAALREAARRKPAQDDLNNMRSNLKPEDQRIHNTLKNATGTHMRFSWGGSGSKAGVRLASRIFFAEQFDALRRFCGCDDNYVASLSRCVKFDSSGGKSGAAFLKTLDDRLIVKQMTKMETEQFLKFAPNYFEYMAESFFQGLPTCLCKILGFYQITSKNPVTGKFFKMDVMVMENLFYKRKTSRIFDLKGSMRNRKVQQTGKENEVLLDENFVELVSENPLFVRDHARRFLKSALHNDTLFLAQNNVMDYSLVVGIDDDKHELVVGIIDFIRTYTWDKKLESWVKERGLVGGGSSKPTVVTPKQYKVRFREAMDRYIYAIK